MAAIVAPYPSWRGDAADWLKPLPAHSSQSDNVGASHGQQASRRLECMPARELFISALEQASLIGLRALLHLKAAFA